MFASMAGLTTTLNHQSRARLLSVRSNNCGSYEEPPRARVLLPSPALKSVPRSGGRGAFCNSLSRLGERQLLLLAGVETLGSLTVARRRGRRRVAAEPARASGQDGVDVEDGAKRNVLVNSKVWISLIEAELERGNDVQALSAAHNLRGFGKAAMVPQKIYTLEDLRLNKIDASKFLSPVDNTLGSIRRNLQLALIAGGIVTWRAFDLSLLQALGAALLFLFLGTVDQVANGGGGEALLIDTLGRQLSKNYKDRVALHEAGHFLISYLMGILPKSYTLSSLDAFKRYSALNIQAGTTFVDFEFQDEVAKGKVSAGTLNKVSCIALAGVATEYVLFGAAEGGLMDIRQLDDLMRGLGFTQRKADGQVRWAVLNTVTLLRRHKDLHSKLATAMTFDKSVAECIGLIESELATVSYI